MSGAGTGLPVRRGDVATTPARLDGMGAAELASAEALEKVQRSFRSLTEALEPAAQQAAAKMARQEAEAGEFRERLAITGADVAFNNAMREGTLARLGNARDQDLDELRTQYAFDPDGFQKAAAEYRANSLDGAVPDAVAVEWAQDFDRRSTSHLSVIRTARLNADLKEAQGALTARRERLVKDVVDAAQGRSLTEVLDDPLTVAALEELYGVHDKLASNPAFGISPEEAEQSRAEDVARIKAGAVSAAMLRIYREEGADAALAALQTFQTDESQPLDRSERQLAFNIARDAVQQEIGLQNQRRNQQEAQRNEEMRELGRLIDEDVALMQSTGQGTGLTAEQVRAVGGNDAVVSWYKRRADAMEFNQLVGDLPLDDPDAAARQITEKLTNRLNLNQLAPVSDQADLSSMVNAIIQVESGGVNGLVSADPDGSGPAGGGAYGIMQILPDTARRMARKLGLAYDESRLRTDAEYNKKLGTAYLSELLDRYNGDTFLAVTAYHAGEGNVDSWLKSVGDPRSGTMTREVWLSRVEERGNPRSAAYPRKVLAALTAGRAAAAWDQYTDRRQRSEADPALTVQADFAVKGARDRWLAEPKSVPAAESYVQANLQAQERNRITSGMQRSLPVSSLATFAGDLTRFEEAGDADGFQKYLQRISRIFGRYGERVVQDVLEVRGDTRFAAQVQARVSQQAAGGTKPSTAQVEEANVAARTEQANRAASGTTNVRALSDAEILAAAGLN